MLLRDPPATPVSPWERGLVLSSCALSVLGCCLLLGSQACWPELRRRPRQLLSCLSGADLLSAASYAYGVLKDFEGSSWDCVAQGALSTFANTSAAFWTVAVALDLYCAIARGSSGARLLCLFHLVSWGIPLGITTAAVALKKIGYDASDVSVGWCWIDINAEDRLLWMLLAGKLWEILAYVTLPFLYILIKKHINRAHAALSEYRPILSRNPSSQPREASVADRKLTLIPIIFIFLRIWSTVRFVLTLSGSPADQNWLLVILHGVGNTFQGAANCILFVFCTRVVRNKLFSSLCCWRHSNPEPPPPSLETSFQAEAPLCKDWELQGSNSTGEDLSSP
ncbi:G-protein coupled receptor 157 [Pantherophis guttatus]|uniref:G-protein coupled receptor 157 n=1 Tax=Pantherophis guttatus TaxID=94885 RepID=A0ABM3YQJ6_PANGU|nr:G-protein coupled receptor 157 [Pantherophis guttatus]